MQRKEPLVWHRMGVLSIGATLPKSYLFMPAPACGQRQERSLKLWPEVAIRKPGGSRSELWPVTLTLNRSNSPHCRKTTNYTNLPIRSFTSLWQKASGSCTKVK